MMFHSKIRMHKSDKPFRNGKSESRCEDGRWLVVIKTPDIEGMFYCQNKEDYFTDSRLALFFRGPHTCSVTQFNI